MNFFIFLFVINWWCLASIEGASKLVSGYILMVVISNRKGRIIANFNNCAGDMCDPLPVIMKNPTIGIKKYLGSPFASRCRSTCNVSYSFFHHNHSYLKGI